MEYAKVVCSGQKQLHEQTEGQVSFFTSPQWGTTKHNIWSSELEINIQGVGVFLPATSEFFQLNDHICNLLFEALGAMDESSGN